MTATKIKYIYDKAVDNHAHALEFFVPGCCMSPKMCNKAANTSPFATQFVPECYMAQEICDKAVSKERFMLKYCLDKYKT